MSWISLKAFLRIFFSLLLLLILFVDYYSKILFAQWATNETARSFHIINKKSWCRAIKKELLEMAYSTLRRHKKKQIENSCQFRVSFHFHFTFVLQVANLFDFCCHGKIRLLSTQKCVCAQATYYMYVIAMKSFLTSAFYFSLFSFCSLWNNTISVFSGWWVENLIPGIIKIKSFAYIFISTILET